MGVDSCVPRVDVGVLDPGWAPGGNVLDPTGDYCFGREGWGGGGSTRIEEPHVWSPVMVGVDGSTWFCSRCRRIERRTVIADDPAPLGMCEGCGHWLGHHVGGCRRCGCRETVIVENGE